jgi:hypothetical protein
MGCSNLCPKNLLLKTDPFTYIPLPLIAVSGKELFVGQETFEYDK